MSTINNNERLNQIDDEIFINKTEIARLEIEKRIIELLEDINDTEVLNYIEENCPYEYNDYVTVKNLYYTLNIKNMKPGDTYINRLLVQKNYDIYKDLYTMLQEFFNLYVCTKYDNTRFMIK